MTDISAPAMFSLSESDSHYIVAIDIPTIPLLATEISSKKNELLVEGISHQSDDQQTAFRFLPQGKNIKATYKDGILWLLLPKLKFG